MADRNPFAWTSPSETKKLEKTYRGRTTKPIDQSKLRVKVKPTARPQPKLSVVPMPSAGGTARAVLGAVQNAPAGLLDLAVNVPKAAYNYLRTSSPSDVLADVKSGAQNVVRSAIEDPGETAADVLVGGSKAAGELLREAALARDAGDEARAIEIEKFAVPMMLAAIVPGGRAAKGAGKTAAKLEGAVAKDVVKDVEKSALAVPVKGKPAAPEPRRVTPAKVAFDPRIETRKGETPKIETMSVELSPRSVAEPTSLSVFDLEGKPFITSMSDMSAAGDDITAINDVPLAEPVSRRGGQDYMFDNPGSVWASDMGPAGRHLELARRLKTETGQNPVFLPWAMGPTAIDFAHMPRELMLQYAASNLNKRGRQALAKDIRGVVPEFRATDDPASIEIFREAVGPQRAALNRLLDQYRDKGGLGIGAARLATTDLEQIGAPLTSLRNVGVIDTGASLSPSTHPSYRTSIPGEGLGRLREPVGALELLPDLMAQAELSGPFDFPVGVVPGVKSPLRALQMGPKGGVITEEMLRAIEERLAARKGEKRKKP